MTGNNARITGCRLVAWVLIVPSIAFAAGTTAIETFRTIRPENALFSGRAAASLAEAIERDEVGRAYEFLRAGQDPNGLIAVRHPALTAGEWALASPLVWATATDSLDSVRMLLGHGARMERPQDASAACLAARLGHRDVERYLRRIGGAPTRCADLEEQRAPLLAYLRGR